MRLAAALVAVNLAGCMRLGFEPIGHRDAPGQQGDAQSAMTDRALHYIADGSPLREGRSFDRLLEKSTSLPDASIVKAPWVVIKPSTFIMGSPATEPCRSAFETAHQVTLTHSYEISSTETTTGDFIALMGYTPSPLSNCGLNCPVANVNWHEAAAYCNKRSQNAGLAACYSCSGTGAGVICTWAQSYSGTAIYNCPGYRLPTDAEWEFAYRAGTTTAYYSGTNSAAYCFGCQKLEPNLDAIAWYCANSGGPTPHPVATRKPNAWMIYDMAGNVWEWCHDAFMDDLGSAPVTDPVNVIGANRVLRGGAFSVDAIWDRAASRVSEAIGSRYQDTGFRCVRKM